MTWSNVGGEPGYKVAKMARQPKGGAKNAHALGSTKPKQVGDSYAETGPRRQARVRELLRKMGGRPR